jgi:hypothetical protein
VQFITTEVGQVMVGGVLLPGTFESLEISAPVKVDEVEIPGKRVTQAVGFDNARVRLNLILVPEVDGGDCSEQIRTIQQLFRKSPDQQKPGVYRIVNKHVQARGINEVIFSDLKTFEDNRSDKVLVICEFTQHVPIQVKVAKKPSGRPAPAPKPSASTSSASKSKPARPYKDPWMQWALDKTAATPAKDTREPSLGKKILAWLRGKDIG